MISRILIPLCLCCVVLCVFVGFLSKRAIKETAQVSAQFVEYDCSGFIEKPPTKSTGLLLHDFISIERIAKIDNDGDEKWDAIAVPLFAPDVLDSSFGYASVIACFRDVPDIETLRQRLVTNELRAVYRVGEQELDSNFHAQLAVQFKNMDFENSPIILVGYDQGNPLLGETSLKLSYMVGAAAIGIAVLAVICTALAGLMNRIPRPERRRKRKPTANRAGLPSNNDHDGELTGGVLDQVRSMRDRQPDT